MGARAIWKGRIQLGSMEVPVKLYSAVQDRTIHFRLLDAKRKEPIKQQMIDPDSGKVVPNDEIQRAIETDSGELVIVEPEELATLEPQESRDISVEQFVKAGAIGPEWYDRPYYLGPDGDEQSYFALAQALEARGSEGICQWVMRKKDYVGSVRAANDYLMLITLRHAGEVVTAASLRPPAGRDLNPREVAMAKQLISALEDELDLTEFQDEYRNRVMELIEAKQAGKIVKFPKAPKRKQEKDLADVLARSLDAVKKRERASA